VLDRHDSIVASELARFRGRIVKSTGDGVLATFDGPARAVYCAAALRDALSVEGVAVRIGIHTGEVELRDDDIGGAAVHIASRVMGYASAGEIVTSTTVKDLVVGSDIAFYDRGEHELKGVPGRWRLFAAEPGA
jgi:class 3 adenylate cyclase